MKKQVLIVDDDESIRIRLGSLLTNNGYDVFTAESASAGFAILKSHAIPVIISDHRMPELSGADFLEIVKNEYPHTVRMVLSEYEDFAAMADAFNKGAIYKFLAKKWNDGELLNNVDSAFVCYEELNRQLALNSSLSKTIEAVVITSKDGLITSVNESFELLMGFKSDDILGKRLDIFDGTHEQLKAIQQGLNQNGCWQGRLKAIKRDKTSFPIFLSITTIKNNLGLVAQVAYYFIDTSERQLMEEQLNYEIVHDKLTGLINRKSFTDEVTLWIKSCQDDQSVVVIAIDLERFRNINNVLGTKAGDEILTSTAQRLKKILTEYNGLVARIGDDQFAIGVKTFKSSSDIYDLIDKIVDNLKLPFTYNNKNIYMDVNTGSSSYPDDGQEAIILLQNAITASNLAKRIGKKNYINFKPDLNKLSQEDMILISDIRLGIRNDEFVFYYQPKIELRTGRIVGAEALLRWNHPKHGVLLPKDFLSICEETYLIVDIERKMLYKGCDFLNKLNKLGNNDLTISLNISAQEFKCANIYVLLKDIIKKTDLPPNLIELEITESNLLHNLYDIKNYLDKIQSLGIQLSLDDFGKGYSSLKYLTVLPFDIVKIDKSFLKNIEHESRKQVIFTAMVELCSKIGLKTVIEGVETPTQLQFVKQLPCDYIQGFLISEPLSEADFLEFVKARHVKNALLQ